MPLRIYIDGLARAICLFGPIIDEDAAARGGSGGAGREPDYPESIEFLDKPCTLRRGETYMKSEYNGVSNEF